MFNVQRSKSIYRPIMILPSLVLEDRVDEEDNMAHPSLR